MSSSQQSADAGPNQVDPPVNAIILRNVVIHVIQAIHVNVEAKLLNQLCLSFSLHVKKMVHFVRKDF